MAHGYMREYDEDRGDNRDRWRDEDRERGWRGTDRDRDWRGSDRERNERNLSFMLGDRDRSWERSDRGMSNFDRNENRFGSRSDWERSPRNFSSGQDDHYRSWRDRQMEALDRDYADYCREREQQFHQDFDSWRQQRHGNQVLQTGMTQTGPTTDPTGTLELNRPVSKTPDPTEEATLGTSSSEPSSRGRR